MPSESLGSSDLGPAAFTHESIDQASGKPEEVEKEQPELQPANTLVQTVGTRPYHLTLQTVHNLSLVVLSFPRGLTLLMSPSDPHVPSQDGAAQLDVHRKFLPNYGKYLHWITFTFQGKGTNTKAQIMLPTRLEAACQLINGGASACFINCPFRVLRRSKNNGRRMVRTVR